MRSPARAVIINDEMASSIDDHIDMSRRVTAPIVRRQTYR
jgi:hypothetical protein